MTGLHGRPDTRSAPPYDSGIAAPAPEGAVVVPGACLFAGSSPRTRRVLRILAVLGVALAIFGPLAFVSSRLWSANDQVRSVAASERDGVAYLRPVVQLVGAVVDAQSTAVAGGRVDAAALRTAVAAVDAVDAQRGGRLGVRDRWRSLRTQVLALANGNRTGADAYAAYTGVVDLSVALGTTVGDTSQLILDPELDSYYLMDTALLRVPAILVQSGRYLDLARLDAARRQPTPDPDAPTPPANVGPSVARDRVASAASAVDGNLRTSVNRTADSAVGPALVQPLDAFRTAATGLAPASALLDPSLATATPGAVATAGRDLQQATRQLAATVLDQLDRLLSARERSARLDQWVVFAAVPVAIVVGILACWLVLSVASPRSGPAVERDPETDLDAADLPAPDRSEQLEEVRALIDARELLRSDELVRVGRAVRPVRRERDSDPR